MNPNNTNNRIRFSIQIHFFRKNRMNFFKIQIQIFRSSLNSNPNIWIKFKSKSKYLDQVQNPKSTFYKINLN